MIEVNEQFDVYWGLLVYTPTGFAWAMGSHERLTLVNERLDMLEMGIKPSTVFVTRFNHYLSQLDIDCLIDHMNSLDRVLNRYLP